MILAYSARACYNDRTASGFAPRREYVCKELVTTPNIKSAKKRVSVIAKKTQKNKMARSSLKTTVKKARLAADNGTADEALAAYADAQKALDKAVSRGLLHKNTAARRKSRLQRKIPKT